MFCNSENTRIFVYQLIQTDCCENFSIMASKIKQLRKALSKLEPSKFDVLSSSCNIDYIARWKEYRIIAPFGRLINCYYSFEHLQSRIQEIYEIEQMAIDWRL